MSAAVLRVEGLHKRFGALAVTSAVSLDVLPGEIHALIGPNGAGKSTLVAQISGQLRPDSGSWRRAISEYMASEVTASWIRAPPES